ncbi:YbjN domain-containing protein [Pseudomonas sp. S 311-6]|uniref:YbjN domain-containing protein n=1 Tax=Kerstersia gyiorum TaxID=206506 RepID=UPI0020979F71|nr:YbjN domain-containing protein [Pseudomonas sp. S 311-6]
MNDLSLIQAMSTARLQELLQDMGYRVTHSEQNGQAQLLSAAQGIGFSVRPGNQAPAVGEFVDYTFACVLRVQGELPDTLVGRWNGSKRFARLSTQGDFLVMEMDVVVAGGVSGNHVRAMIELWDRLLQEFVLFLRQFAMMQADAAKADSDPEAAIAATSAEAAAAGTAA